MADKAISLRLPEELLAEVDEFGFGARIRSRNEVLKMLIRDGLRVHGKPSSASSAETASSTDRATR